MLTIGMRMERPRLQSIVSSTPLVHGRCLHSSGADNEAFLVPNKCIETNYLVRRVERPFVTSLPWLFGTPWQLCFSCGFDYSTPSRLLRPHVVSMYFGEWSAFIFSIESRVLNGQWTVKKWTAFRIPMNPVGLWTHYIKPTNFWAVLSSKKLFTL